MEGCAGQVLHKGIQPKGEGGLKSRLCYGTRLTMVTGTELSTSGKGHLLPNLHNVTMGASGSPG